MKYQYTIEIINLENSKKIKMVLPEEVKMVTAFLFSSIQDTDTAAWFLNGLDLVLSGESGYEEFDGEIYGVKVRPDFSSIYNTIQDDNENNECKIETSELKELILAWMEELKKFRSQPEAIASNSQENPSQENQSS